MNPGNGEASSMTDPAVVQAVEVAAERTASGARVRPLLIPSPRGPRLGRRIVDVPAGAHFDGVGAVGGELWFVVTGDGQLDIESQPGLPVIADRALWVPPDARYRLRANGSDLHLDAVALPATASEPGPQSRDSVAAIAIDLHDCAIESTGDRKFRVLFGPARGCAVATQFVGEIPPGRAPAHSHPYDEVVLVLAGEGVLHLGDGSGGDGRSGDHPLIPGTCAHLPPGQPHCLENTGTTMMRVLGVFHPADSPAAKDEGV
jgi:mannose-6-phosphate isomerase-like protein (cupin superfamily)